MNYDKKNICFLLFSLISIKALAWKFTTDTSPNWLPSIKALPSVYTEMNKYFLKKDPSYDAKNYVAYFVPTIHAGIAKETQNTIQTKLAQTFCTPFTQVT